jgi:hypothetical protein
MELLFLLLLMLSSRLEERNFTPFLIAFINSFRESSADITGLLDGSFFRLAAAIDAAMSLRLVNDDDGADGPGAIGTPKLGAHGIPSLSLLFVENIGGAGGGGTFISKLGAIGIPFEEDESSLNNGATGMEEDDDEIENRGGAVGTALSSM